MIGTWITKGHHGVCRLLSFLYCGVPLHGSSRYKRSLWGYVFVNRGLGSRGFAIYQTWHMLIRCVGFRILCLKPLEVENPTCSTPGVQHILRLRSSEHDLRVVTRSFHQCGGIEVSTSSSMWPWTRIHTGCLKMPHCCLSLFAENVGYVMIYGLSASVSTAVLDRVRASLILQRCLPRKGKSPLD